MVSGLFGQRRTPIKRWFLIPPLALAALLAASGCADVGVPLFGSGGGVNAGTGVSYTLDSIAYKTFTVSAEQLRRATLQALKRMDIQMKEDQPTESGRKIMAQALDREIQIDLDRLTAKTSRIRVDARHGRFFKDRATATEIIVQTERTLGDGPVTGNEAASPPVSAQKKPK